MMLLPIDASANANCAAVMQMICMYIAEFTIHIMSDQLKWWAENSIKTLAARQFFCLPLTNVPSERLFSGAGFICCDSRSRLHPEG